MHSKGRLLSTTVFVWILTLGSTEIWCYVTSVATNLTVMNSSYCDVYVCSLDQKKIKVKLFYRMQSQPKSCNFNESNLFYSVWYFFMSLPAVVQQTKLCHCSACLSCFNDLIISDETYSAVLALCCHTQKINDWGKWYDDEAFFVI